MLTALLVMALSGSPDVGTNYASDFLLGDPPLVRRDGQWAHRPTREQIRSLAPVGLKYKTAVRYACDVGNWGILSRCEIRYTMPKNDGFIATIPFIQKSFVLKKELLTGAHFSTVEFTVGFAEDSSGNQLPSDGCYLPFCAGVPSAPQQ